MYLKHSMIALPASHALSRVRLGSLLGILVAVNFGNDCLFKAMNKLWSYGLGS